MLPEMCAFEETQCYKDILMEGKTEGEINLRKQDVENYQSLKNQGILPEEAYQILVSPLKERIEQLEVELKNLQGS